MQLNPKELSTYFIILRMKPLPGEEKSLSCRDRERFMCLAQIHKVWRSMKRKLRHLNLENIDIIEEKEEVGV